MWNLYVPYFSWKKADALWGANICALLQLGVIQDDDYNGPNMITTAAFTEEVKKDYDKVGSLRFSDGGKTFDAKSIPKGLPWCELRESYEKGELPKEIGELQMSLMMKAYAEKGDCDAMLKLGNGYYEGRYGCPKDKEKGFLWAKKAARQNHFPSLLWLATTFLSETKSEEAYPYAVRCLRHRQAAFFKSIPAKFRVCLFVIHVSHFVRKKEFEKAMEFCYDAKELLGEIHDTQDFHTCSAYVYQGLFKCQTYFFDKTTKLLREQNKSLQQMVDVKKMDATQAKKAEAAAIAALEKSKAELAKLEAEMKERLKQSKQAQIERLRDIYTGEILSAKKKAREAEEKAISAEKKWRAIYTKKMATRKLKDKRKEAEREQLMKKLKGHLRNLSQNVNFNQNYVEVMVADKMATYDAEIERKNAKLVARKKTLEKRGREARAVVEETKKEIAAAQKALDEEKKGRAMLEAEMKSMVNLDELQRDMREFFEQQKERDAVENAVGEQVNHVIEVLLKEIKRLGGGGDGSGFFSLTYEDILEDTLVSAYEKKMEEAERKADAGPEDAFVAQPKHQNK